YLGIGFPTFLVIIISLLMGASIFDRIGFDEAFESLQSIIPVFITYIGAILGFSFNTNSDNKKMENAFTNSDDTQRIVRVYVSIILSTSMMLLHVTMTLAFIFGKVTFENFKIGSAAITWTMAGAVSFIIGKYFGESTKLIKEFPEQKNE
ncbi:membrane protein, partial [Candidatus Magnetomorum sp. HK-1]